ncbi:MAG: YtrH family sporulation protein [Alicyclobacillaceae bacterium]|nr:YtrH family sporulation protein [Alicyclobacillaceae bacterium]
MDRFTSTVVLDFFVAFGIVLGGSLAGGAAAILFHLPPGTTMMRLADHLKIWGLVSALGGTIDTLRVIETGVLGGQLSPVAKQFTYLIAAFLGSHTAYLVLKAATGVKT